MDINWIKVSEGAYSGLITLIVSFFTVFFHSRLTRWGNRRRESILFDLAVPRGSGVELRNFGERAQLSPAEFEDWSAKVDAIERAIIDKAAELSKVEGKRLEYLDRVQPLSYPHIGSSAQVGKLQNLSGILLKSDMLLSKYRF